MIAGQAYFPSNKELQRERLEAKTLCYEFNNTSPKEVKLGRKILKSLLGESGSFWIEPPFYCDYGYNISTGRNFYLNHGVTILDPAPVTFGDDVMIGPGVLISTATHPLDVDSRRKGIESALPISVGNGVWVGMGAKIVPGVSIGDGAVVAAGSVVNKDVSAYTMVAGVPAKKVKWLK